MQKSLCLAASLIGLSGPVLAETPDTPATKPHLRFIVMDSRFDITQEAWRTAMQDACTALGKVNLVANQREAKETVEQVVDCLYFKPGKQPKLMHLQFYQMLMPKAPPEVDGSIAWNIKAGLVPVKEMLDHAGTAQLGTYLLSDKPLRLGKAMAATVTMNPATCSKTGCSTVAKIPDLGAFFKAGGIDTEKASAWQMALPPQLYVSPEHVAARQPYRMDARAVSFSR